MTKFLILFLSLFITDLFAQTQINTLTPPTSGTYTIGQAIDFEVEFTDSVTVSGTPRLALNIGGNLKYANYVSGNGTNQLTFRYIVKSGFSAPTGVGVASPVQLNGGTIIDSQSAPALLTFKNVFYSGVVVSAPPPAILSVTVLTAPKTNFLAGDIINFQVKYSEPVTVSNSTTRLKILIGSNVQAANYISGSGSDTHSYRLTLAIDGYDTDGIQVSSPLESGTAQIQNLDGVPVLKTFNPPDLTSYKVDARVPTITSNTRPADGTYFSGNTFEFILTYSRNVNVTGNPRVQINVGLPPTEIPIFADYVSGSGTNQITFRYTIDDGDIDDDGVYFNQWLNMDLGSISDEVGNSASFAFWGLKMPNYGYSLAKLSGNPVPVITSIDLPTAGYYLGGQSLDFVANFSQDVNVTGSPRLAIATDSGTVYATYQSSPQPDKLLFRYTVAPNISDLTGIVLSSPLQLNGGTIKNSITATNANLSFSSPNTSSIKLDALPPTISSVQGPPSGTYTQTQDLLFNVDISEPSLVTGTPSISVVIGSSTKQAEYDPNISTPTTLVFKYSIGPGDSDNNGIVLQSPISLNGGSITDVAGNSLSALTFTPPNLSSVRVSGTTFITDIAPPNDGTYTVGQSLNFTVTYSAPANVTGAPRLRLTVGSTTAYATYFSGSGTDTHIFRYTVLNGHNDLDGIATTGTTLDSNGGTIRDSASNNVSLAITAQTYSQVKVDAFGPTISNVTPPANATYANAEFIDFYLNYTEIVTVTGAPRLTLTVGSTTQYATYLDGSGSTSLRFRYIVASGLSDTNGINLSNTLSLNGGAIKDSLNNSQTTLTFTVPSLTGVRVDSVSPIISSFTTPTSKTYIVGQTIIFRVNFSESVNITGSPGLNILVGSVIKTASYASGSGSKNIYFEYTIENGDIDTDGVSTLPPLILNSGAITDIAGNPASLTFGSSTFANVKVDGVAPTITGITPPVNGGYSSTGSRRQLNFIVSFSEVVKVTGTPRIVLTIGSNTRNATYVSGSNTQNLTFRYSPVSADLDFDGIEIGNSNQILLNGGAIKDSGGTDAPLDFGSIPTSKIRVVFSTLTNWYDLSDEEYLVFNGFDVSAINDLISSYNLVHSGSGAPYEPSNFNDSSNGFVTCSAQSSFDGSSSRTARAMVAVYRAPNNVTNQYLLYSGANGRPMVQFSSFSSGGTLSMGINGNKYSGSNWPTSAATIINSWNPQEAKLAGYSWTTTQNNRPRQICQMDGELAELFFFSSVPTVAQMQAIQTYIQNRYGLSF